MTAPTTASGTAAAAGGFGVIGVGTFAPPVEQTVETVAKARGLDAALLRRDAGFERRFVPERDVSPFHLVAGAARAALADAGVGPGDLDKVVTVGRSRAEYLCWSLGLALMKELRIPGAVSTDVCDSTGGTLLSGLRVLSARFRADPSVKMGLLAVHQRASDLVDHASDKDRRLWALGDGGAALVVRRGDAGVRPLASAFANEGRAGALMGTRFEILDEGPNPQDFFEHEWAQAKYLSLRDPEAWWTEVRTRAVRRLPEVVRLAVQRSGLTMDRVARVEAGFLFPEVGEEVRRSLALGDRFRWRNGHGLMGGAELGWSLQGLREDRDLRGRHVVLASMGLPANYGAMVVRL